MAKKADLERSGIAIPVFSDYAFGLIRRLGTGKPS
jgi:hypothetical protein